MDAPVQKRACGQQHVPRCKFKALRGAHAGNVAIVGGHVYDRILPDAQPGRVVQGLFEHALIGLAVDLGAGGAHGRALAHVQHAKLYASRVGPQAHHAAEGVDFAHHMALGQAADGGVARKIAKTVKVAADEQYLVTHAGKGHGSFTASVAAACDNTVKCGIRHGMCS